MKFFELKQMLFVVALIACAHNIQAGNDTTYWTFSGNAALMFSQASFSNWSAGGENSYSLNSKLDLKYNYAKEKVRWDNELNLGYGFLDQDGLGYRKTDDLFNFLSKYGYQASKRWFYTAMVQFTTQFTEGYDYGDNQEKTFISDLMAPAYFVGSLGVEYRIENSFKVFITPLANKITFVENEILAALGSFGLDAGENMRYELGASVLASYKKEELFKNVGLETKLGLFSNYTENPENVDVNWELYITMKVNKYLSANISTHLIYDDDIDSVREDGSIGGPKLQFKEMLGIGLQYSF